MIVKNIKGLSRENRGGLSRDARGGFTLIEPRRGPFRAIRRGPFRTSGFTLIELLVAIAILGIVAAIGFGIFSSGQSRGRDSKRKSDLGAVKTALESYYQDNHQYSSVNDLVSGGYLKSIPQDPKDPTFTYNWDIDPQDFTLWAQLENTSDPEVCTNPKARCQETSTPPYNYCVKPS